MRKFSVMILTARARHKNIGRKTGKVFLPKTRSRGEGAAALRRVDSDAALGNKTARDSRDFWGVL